ATAPAPRGIWPRPGDEFCLTLVQAGCEPSVKVCERDGKPRAEWSQMSEIAHFSHCDQKNLGRAWLVPIVGTKSAIAACARAPGAFQIGPALARATHPQLPERYDRDTCRRAV